MGAETSLQPYSLKVFVYFNLTCISVLLAGKITTCMQHTWRSENKSFETGVIGACELPCGY